MNNPALICQAYAFATVVLWSTAYVYTKVALAFFTPGPLGLVRCAVASLSFLVILPVMGKGRGGFLLPGPAFRLAGCEGDAQVRRIILGFADFSQTQGYSSSVQGTRGRLLLSVDHQNTQPSIRICWDCTCTALNTSSGYSRLLWQRKRRPLPGRR